MKETIQKIILGVLLGFVLLGLFGYDVVDRDEPYNCNCGEWINTLTGKTYCGLVENPEYDKPVELWKGYLDYLNKE